MVILRKNASAHGTSIARPHCSIGFCHSRCGSRTPAYHDTEWQAPPICVDTIRSQLDGCNAPISVIPGGLAVIRMQTFARTWL